MVEPGITIDLQQNTKLYSDHEVFYLSTMNLSLSGLLHLERHHNKKGKAYKLSE